MSQIYPQDDSPLCCCEYYNRRGERAHVLACCCQCDELDGAGDRLLRGKPIGYDSIDSILVRVAAREHNLDRPGITCPPLMQVGPTVCRRNAMTAFECRYLGVQ